MFNCIGLGRKNIMSIKELNENRKNFNLLNSDFFKEYNSSGYAQQIFLMKKVRVLKCNSDNIGYLWTASRSRANTCIKSFYAEGIDMCFAFNKLIESTGRINLSYMCVKNEYNFRILEEVGFKKHSGTLGMIKSIDEKKDILLEDNISFRNFRRGMHEKIRCDLQNDIFRNSKRIPLTVEDIFYDELQSYYLNEGSIFILYRDKYIGYGQIIMDEGRPTIVNFGITEKYRNNGYGKMLLLYLLNIIRDNNYDKAYIKVNADNHGAIKLYQCVGFQIDNEIYKWIYNKK